MSTPIGPTAFARRRCAGALMIAALAMLLGACAESGISDLREFVDDTKQRKGRVEPLPEFRMVETYSYAATSLRDPFGSANSEARAAVQERGGSGLRPDTNRRREVLESYPLDTLRMLGTLEFQQATWGLVKAPDGVVHRVRTGNHLGQNYGRIRSVEAQKLMLTEIVPDGLGGWEERETYLAMNEQ